MRHVVAFILIVFAFVCVSARPAEAQGVFIEWLERLSGPGPSKGIGVHVTFRCFGVRTTERGAADDVAAAGTPRFFTDLGCARSARTRFRVAFGVQASWASGDNNLDYDASVPADERETVKMSTYVGTVDVGVHPGVEVGVGAGFVRFSDLPVDSFTRVTVQPVRVIWKPLVTFEGGGNLYRREALQLRFIATMFPGGFDAEDFGAIPGTFESRKEIQGSFSILVDLLALVAK